MILIGYRHGLRASELCDLQWSQVELNTGRLHVRRAKNGSPSVHPLQGDEIRALRRLQREQGPSSHVFMTERDGPMTPKAFHALFGRIGARGGCRSRCIRTCCAMAVAMPWPMPATIRAACRHISGTRIFSTRCATPSWRRIGSRTFGDRWRPARAAPASLARLAGATAFLKPARPRSRGSLGRSDDRRFRGSAVFQ
jgi:hypothetical protein